MKKLIVIAILSIFLVSIIVYYDKKEREIALEEIMQVKSAKELRGDQWYILIGVDDDFFKEVGLSAKDFDFQKYNLIVTNGRKIKKMYFRRLESFPFRRLESAEAILNKEFDSHTWYIYKTKEMDVLFDERSRTNSIIED